MPINGLSTGVGYKYCWGKYSVNSLSVEILLKLGGCNALNATL